MLRCCYEYVVMNIFLYSKALPKNDHIAKGKFTLEAGNRNNLLRNCATQKILSPDQYFFNPATPKNDL